ncbi:MAG: Gfo/Idh/MocA family oxidoreductase [Verrucomicrobia bacterium]|nr:Gfo/Idh/MocA family oxidoreductase [Verrucomicrobiota bacterium]MCG2681841.1 Gfo/Idh/MocA family oxidoreductase [Kiritimatiellia bacterium]MBU4247723.1 Gfo/Idh/MocA family oxidoreductase [Verrucomicrobiota bacterium]MBU4291626.1 Gfo/Idh/MocA family oxidoreductase [Verrucomicrobiota bacterium]MBU4429557.1 Gfo/Idh/MocA family oxidoreductase [Verrucomicrobiota bacterium]
MIKVAIIGLDTSHSVEFPRLMQAPDCAPDQRVAGLKAVTCLRFETPFQNKAGLDKRQEQLEAWGVKVTEKFEETVASCDAIMLEINDPAYHLEYFNKVAALGKPVFLDKPLAGSEADGREILQLIRQHQTRVWSGSGVPFCPPLGETCARFAEIKFGQVFGALGQAPAGDALVWYGVHTFEMLQRIMGPGPKTVRAIENDNGIIAVVDYGKGRQGFVELIRGSWLYGGRLQGKCGNQEQVAPFVCDLTYDYRDTLREVLKFFEGGAMPVAMETTFEGLAMMLAARESIIRNAVTPVAAL